MVRTVKILTVIAFACCCIAVFLPNKEETSHYKVWLSDTEFTDEITITRATPVEAQEPDSSVRVAIESSRGLLNISDRIPIRVLYSSASFDGDTVVYTYYLDNTDAIILYKNGKVGFVQNKYGASLPILYFEDGVPSNSKDLYKRLQTSTGYIVGAVSNLKKHSITINGEVYKY